MNEYEIRRALAAAPTHAAVTPDPDRMRAALVHADRMKTIRMAMAVGAVTLVASLGLFLAQTGESTAPLDVVDQPDVPTPDPGLPVLEIASTETTTTTAAPTTTVPPAEPDADPDHLATPSTTTTAPPALIAVTTTRPPVTTTAPPPSTTAPPTTTAAPTTSTTSTTSTTTTTVPVEFSAQARYGFCEEDPPYDEYSGTAAPGSTITVTSLYSSTAQVTADGNGDWFLRVEFPTAPVAEHFDVTVGDGTDTAVFDFVRTA